MASAESIARAIHRQVDQIRARNGLGTLTSDHRLAEAAARHNQSMSSEEFFSHHSPIAGLERPRDRVRACGGRFDAVGENIAMLGEASADASAFVTGWMESPGHRANILTSGWNATGVAVYAGPDGQVFATQLFATTPALLLDEPRLAALARTWFVVRLEARIGQGYALGGFVRNRFVASAEADGAGVVRLEAEIPATSGRHHVGFGRRRAGTEDGWIGVHEGTAEIRGDGTGVWHQGPAPHDGCTVTSEALFRVDGTALVLELDGIAREPALAVVDGERRTEARADERFAWRLEFRAGAGAHQIHVGRKVEGDRYTVDRVFRLDAEIGCLTEEEK